MRGNPLLLKGNALCNENDIRLRRIDLRNNLRIRPVAVTRPRDSQVRIIAPHILHHALNHPLPRPIEEEGNALLGGRCAE